MSASTQRIYLTRHAEAEHNVASDWSIRDAPLTHRGRQQASQLNQLTKHTIQSNADLLVSSGLRRTLSTTVVGYAGLRKRLEAEGKPVIVLPQLQETKDLPCHTGSAREILEADPEYAGLDLSSLTPDWTSKAGFYSATEDALRARARWVRRWLRARPEQHIVVVCHADCLRYITHGWNTQEPWPNAEVREYTFAIPDEAEDTAGDAWLVPVAEVVKGGEVESTSSQHAAL